MQRYVFGLVVSAMITAPAMACGPSASGTHAIPPLAANLDRKIAASWLSAAKLKQVRSLRSEIARLLAEHDEGKAREVEEQAMKLLGYVKEPTWCGTGSFKWSKQS